MLSTGAKKNKFYHISVILQYCWDKTIARSGGKYRDASGILNWVIKCFGITNTSVQNFDIRISSVKTAPKCLRKLNVFFNKFNIDVSFLLMSSLRSIVICQKYFGNHVISSQTHHFAPLLNTRRCTLWVCTHIYYYTRDLTYKMTITNIEIGNIYNRHLVHWVQHVWILMKAESLYNLFENHNSFFHWWSANDAVMYDGRQRPPLYTCILSVTCTYFRWNRVTLYTKNSWAGCTCIIPCTLYTNVFGVKCQSRMSCYSDTLLQER